MHLLAVLLSGSGRTLTNLVEQIDHRKLSNKVRVELVIASKVCAGCDRARELGLKPLVMPGEIPAATLGPLLEQHKIDLVLLAGYLKKLHIPAGFEGRVVNIHPALLPDFGGPGMYGHHVHEAVLARGCKTSGCTVHFCDSQYDTGAIIVQRSCPVLADDTPGALAARVFAEECKAYPEALERLIKTVPPRGSAA